MEIFKELKTPASKEFEKLLNSQFSKNKDLVEGKIIQASVTKVSDKFVFLHTIQQHQYHLSTMN